MKKKTLLVLGESFSNKVKELFFSDVQIQWKHDKARLAGSRRWQWSNLWGRLL
jgi:hypothetical protein